MRAAAPLTLLSAALLTWLACALPDLGDPTAPPAGGTMPAMAWEDLMAEIVGPGFDDILVREAGADPEEMDFDAIERTAQAMASAIAQGYGPLEKKEVPQFASHARSTEQWLLSIAGAAIERRGETVQRLIAEGETRYCQRCHDAADGAR